MRQRICDHFSMTLVQSIFLLFQCPLMLSLLTHLFPFLLFNFICITFAHGLKLCSLDLVNLAGGTAVYLSTSRAAFLSGRFVFSNWDMEQLEKLKEQILNDDLLTSHLRFGDHLDNAVLPSNEN